MNFENIRQHGKPLTLKEIDGLPIVNDVGEIIVSDDTLTDLGDGSVSLDTGGGVDSVNGQTGVVVLDADDIDDTATTNKFVTSTDITNLANLSGVNTGDQDLSGKQDTLVSGTNIKTINGTTILGAGDLVVAGGVTSVNGETGVVILDADDIDDTTTTNKFVTSSDLTNLANLSGTNTGDQDLSGLLPYTMTEDTLDPTGWLDGDNIAISYNWTARTITLTGDLSYYWRGSRYELTSPWTSPAHAATTGGWFLCSNDGGAPTWSQAVWDFKNLQTAYVNYQSTEVASFGMRETHGLMDFETHEELHSQIGTYRVSGGQLTAGTYTLNSATDTATTPGFDAAVLKDEDVSTSVPVWTEGTYTTMHIGAGSTSVFNTASSFPFIVGSAGQYLQVNNALTGTMTQGVNSRYYNVYQIMMPVTNDASSQKYRMIMLQPQVTFTSSAAALAEDVRGLLFGQLFELSPEFNVYSRITYLTGSGNTNTGKCRIAAVSYNIGNKAGQVSVSGFSGSDHSVLSSLEWVDSGHTGTADSFATFDGSGLATSQLISTKQDTLVSGTSIKTINSNSILTSGDLTLSTDIHSNITALDAVSGTNTGDETQSTIKTKLGAATTSADGYLTSTDWNTFNGKVTNPMITAGDIIYGGTGGAPTRLGVGTAGQVLATNSGATAPVWIDTSSGGISWGSSISGTSGTGMTTTLSNNSSSGAVGQRIVIENTQTNATVGMSIDMGNSSAAHTGIKITKPNITLSGSAIEIDLTGTGAGAGILFKGTSTNSMYALKFSDVTGNMTLISATGITHSTGSNPPVIISANITSIANSNISWDGNYIRFTHSLRAAATRTDNCSAFEIKRTSATEVNASANLIAQGAVLKIENSSLQTAGTLTDSVCPLLITQSSLSTGVPIKIVQNAVVSTNFKKLIEGDGITIWKSNGTTPNGSLSSTAGDICLNGTGGQTFYCTGTTNWTGM